MCVWENPLNCFFKGAAEFSNTTFCTMNNYTIDLSFNPISSEFDITNIGCDVLLFGCDSGFEVASKNTNDSSIQCDTCIKSSVAKFWYLIISLTVLCIILTILLIIIIASFVIYKLW